MLSNLAWRRQPLAFVRTARHSVFLLGALCLAQQVSANPVYKCERLKEIDLNVEGYYPSAINDAGEVAGTVMGFFPIKWNKQREGLVLKKDFFAMGTYANGINNDGVVVGASIIEGPHPEGITAYKWLPDGSFVRLLKLDGQRTSAADINDQGVIAGWASTDGLAAATLWRTENRQTTLPALEAGKSAYPHRLNNREVVVGEAVKTVDGQEVVRAVRWRNGKVRDLGTLPGMNSSLARAINDPGLIVGISMDTGTPGVSIPVAWVDGAIQALDIGGSTFGSAAGANRHGEIVGHTSALGATYWAGVNAPPMKVTDLISADKPCRGPQGQATNLNSVRDINARGVIAASGTWIADDGSTDTGAFRLVPMKAD